LKIVRRRAGDQPIAKEACNMKDFTTSQENGNADVMDKVEDWEI